MRNGTMEDDSSPLMRPRPFLRKRQSSITDIAKRNKASRACDACRRRKVKCDGKKPCSRCQKSTTECLYDNASQKREPPKQYVETHEPRLRALESALSAIELKSAGTDCSSSLLGEGASPPLPKPAVKANTAVACQSSAEHTDHVDGISVSIIGQGHYVRDQLARIDRIPCSGELTELDHEPAQPDINNGMVPIQMDLIQAYFNHVHPYLPILHCPSFYEQLQTKPCPFLLNAVYAVASKWHSSASKSSSEPWPGWRYYITALSWLDIYVDAPRLSTIQALLLLIKYNEHARRPGFFRRTRLYFQIIIRMCKDLGLSRGFRNCSQTYTVEIEQRKRVFWAVFAYDILMSTEQGTKPNFNLNDCTAEYPSLLQDETQSEEQEYLLHFYWMTKVVHVHASVLDFMRRKYTQKHNESVDDEQRTFQELQSRLDELRTQLTSTIPLPRNFSNSKKRYMTSFVHMALHFVTILLHRPYAFQNSTRGNHLALHQERCSLAALTITQITEVLVKDDGVECLCYFMRGIQQVMHYLSAAVTVYSSRNGSNASVGGNNLSERSLALIQQLIEKSPATELDSKFDENLLPCPQTKNKSKASENLPARFDSHNTTPVKAASPKTAKPRRMSAKLGSARPNTPQRKASTTRPLSWDVNSNVSLSFLMQSSAAITDPAGRHHLGFPTPPAAITQSPYPYYPLQTHMLGPGIDQQTSTHFPITNYTQPLSSSAEYYPSFDPAEMMSPYPVFVPSSMYCSPVGSSDMYAHPLPSGHPPSGTPIQHNPYVTTIPPFSSPSTSSSQRRHTVSGTCQQPNPALLAEMNALTATNGIPPSLPPNMNLSSSHIDSTMQGHASQMLIDESYLTEPPPTGMQPQSMMSLLTGHDSSWDYSNRVQNA